MNALIEKTIDGLKLDRSEWKLVKFDDVAIQQKESVDRENTELTRYVKGEHMYSEDIHLREWGELTDEYLGPAFIRKFEEGDILYGSRRTYLRKVVIAPFDGITSNTTFVIKANEKKIDKRLLPFVMMSEGFTQHSIRNSKGSVNPYVNWKDLAGYEFLLPPKEQQDGLTELFLSLDLALQNEKYVKSMLEKTYQVAVDNYFSETPDSWSYMPVSDVAFINKESLNENTDREYCFRYLDIASILKPKVIGEMKRINFGDAPSRARRKVFNGSIILSLVRPYQRSFAFIEESKDIISSTGTAVVSPREGFNSRFVFHQFFSSRFSRFCESRMTGTNYPSITPKDVAFFDIAVPNDSRQIDIIAAQLDVIEKSEIQIELKILSSEMLQKNLINEVF